MNRWVFSFICFLAINTIASAEQTPVTLTITPKTAVPGAAVTIKGTSGIDVENATTIKVLITAPTPSKVTTLTPAINKEGVFQAVFTETKEIGTYTVKVSSPGGFGSATDKFSVIMPASAIEDYNKEFEELLPVVDEGTERITKILDALPDSKDKEETEQKLEKLKTRVKDIKQQVSLTTILKPLQAQFSKVPEELSVAGSLYIQLDDWKQQSEEERKRIDEELKKSAEEGEDCEKIDQAIEAINLVSALLNCLAAPINIVRNFAEDLTGSKISGWVGDTGGALLKAALGTVDAEAVKAEEMVGKASMKLDKTGLQLGPIKLSPSPAGASNSGLALAFDLSNVLFKGYYGTRCERFEGPLTGKMDGEIAKNGQVYWKFSIGLKGKLILRHAKADPNTAIRVHGQMMGFGTNFSVMEDMVAVLFPNVLKATRAMTFHKVTTPPVYTALDAWNDVLSTQGAIPQTLGSPTSFYIPVEGDLVKDKLTLRIQPARFDFNEEKVAAHAVYVLLSPIAMAPYVINQSLPYKNADFIITHAMKAEDTRQAELNLSVDSATKSTILSGDFKRDFENKEAEATATYTLTLKACNPACQ